MLDRLIDAADLVVASAAPFVEDDELRGPATTVRNARKRSDLLARTIVVALAGGTGSGKSSLLNAIAGEQVAETGPIRPTTATAMAWIPATPEPGLVRLLDDIGVTKRSGHHGDPSLAILDMPDTDSVVGAHRATFERLLPRVDAVVWVVDPEKYNDRLLHREYLEPLAAYSRQFVFVLNQIDRLAPSEVQEVLYDFERRLAADGISEPLVLPVAADPGRGVPVGVDRLVAELQGRLTTKQGVLAKLALDVTRAVDALAASATVAPDQALRFDERWEALRTAATHRLADALAGEEIAARAERRGAAWAARVGAGPVRTVTSGLRGTRIGRAIGMVDEGVAVDETVSAWRSRPGLEATLADVDRLISDMAASGAAGLDRALTSAFAGEATAGGEVDTDALVQQAVERARHKIGPFDLGSPRRAWKWAQALKWLLTLAVIAAGIWWWAVPGSVQQGEWPWPVIVVVLSLAIGFAVTRVVQDSGRRRGREAAGAYRLAAEQAVGEALDVTLGRPLRRLARARAELEAALVEAKLAALAVEEALGNRIGLA